MGMDSVEIILRTEDEFVISIPDDEAETASTVGGLYNIVLSKLSVTPGCLTSKAFYVTRRALIEVLQVPRRSIRTATTLSPLLPDETRQQQWQRIRESIGLLAPPLRIPGAVKQDLYKRAFFFSSVIAVFVCFASLSLGWWSVPVFVMSVMLWIALTMTTIPLLQRLSPMLASELPADTAGELARIVLGMNYENFASASKGQKPTNEDIWRRLVDIICDQLQVDRDEVVPNARFVDDLGVD